MRLDDTQSASRRSQLDARQIAAASEMARLEAERAEGAQLAVDGGSAKRQGEPAVARVLGTRPISWPRGVAIAPSAAP